MSSRRMIGQAFGIMICTLLAGFGCQTLHNAGLPGMEPFLKVDPAKVEEENNHREQFAIHRDHKSFYWLLANQVSSGMSLTEVETALGEPGEHTTEFSRMKSEGQIQTTDSAYRWGPDRQGNSAILFFRDGRLVNFNRKDFVTP